MAALLALASSLVWGTGDFLGGRAARGHSVLQVLFWSQLATLVALWGSVAVWTGAGDLQVEARAIGIGALGGVAALIGLASFYRALAIGPMSVVPPIAASGVALPVVLGLATGAAPSSLTYAGIALACVGVILASVGDGEQGIDANVASRLTSHTLGLCLASAVGFGLFFVALAEATGDSASSALVATAGVRLGSFSTLLVAIAASRTRPAAGVTPRLALAFAGIGMFDVVANLLFAVAAAFGELEVVAVLGSLYPAVTSALAMVVLGERAGRLQLVGVAFALGGVAVLAGA